VIVGLRTAPEDWRVQVTQAFAEGRWLVQEYLESRPYLFQQGDRGVAIHDLVWGMFCFGATYGGGFVRMVPRDRNRTGVINSARGADEGIIFEVKDDRSFVG
jgi:hypothetical protein